MTYIRQSLYQQNKHTFAIISKGIGTFSCNGRIFDSNKNQDMDHMTRAPNGAPSLSFATKVREVTAQGITGLLREHGRDCATQQGSCLKTGQHFIFVIVYLLLPINCTILDSVSKILFHFFIANNNNYDSNNENIAP